MAAEEKPEEIERKLRDMVVELRILEGNAQELQSRLGTVEMALREYNMAETTVKGLEQMEADNEILVPVGGGTFIKAKIADTDKLMVSIGAEVTTEKTAKEAVALLETRQAELNSIRNSLQKQFTQLLNRMQVLRGEIQRITGSLRT
ncbi:prefoldin subunit alpha [Candidatus Hecatella orcuttiae]|jgi:prefoldin alpha subunit|uniref:prefoldin subunit alpha n=1 Tax=Candidatus Hecatella orcuttiae TaxID=1935119 RepID=UPI0028680B81|nr:prefoldin subunit alpha [Candidatus Hecatella orcuttiae]